MRFSNLPKVKDREAGLQTQVSSDLKPGSFLSYPGQKEKASRKREGRCHFLLPPPSLPCISAVRELEE